jgi:sarcosine oxidase
MPTCPAFRDPHALASVNGYVGRFPSMTRVDVIVVGLGVTGSATAWQLARRGVHVLAFDRYDPPHTLGSTHGRTRITREAYFEDPAYVPFIRRAHALWEETERTAGARLFLRTGGLMVGPPDGEIIAGSRESARRYAIPHELLPAAEIRRRFPAFQPSDDMVGLLEHGAGILFPEAIVAAHLMLARKSGADLRTGERVHSWNVTPSGVTIAADSGEYHAERLVLAAGPWMPDLLSLGLPLNGERQTMYWFTPVPGSRFPPEDYPIALWDVPGMAAFATFPDLGDGVKIAVHHGGSQAHPDTMDRMPRPEDERAVRDRLARFVPLAHGTLREAAVCIYTNTPDRHFIIDFLDEARRVVVLSPCSGHGFKFGSAVGEAAACLATDAQPPVDLSLFALSRFIAPVQPAD